jgi:hypothetical protein
MESDLEELFNTIMNTQPAARAAADHGAASGAGAAADHGAASGAGAAADHGAASSDGAAGSADGDAPSAATVD